MFPEKIKWFKRPIGWKDLGEKESWIKGTEGTGYCTASFHPFCKSRVHVGEEIVEGKRDLFLFCPRCLVKVKD